MSTVYNDINKLRKKVLDKYKGEFEVLSYGEEDKTAVIIHVPCGEKFTKKIRTITEYSGCAICGYKNMKKRVTTITTDDFKRKVEILVGDEYTVLGEYIKAKTKVRMRHNNENCNNHVYYVTPSDFNNGRRCPKCALLKRIDSRLKSPEDFKRELEELTGGDYEPLDEYTRWNNHIRVKHVKCGYVYKVSPNAILNGRGCPRCSTPKGEIWVETALKELGVRYETQKRFEGLEYKKPLSYDFYLPDSNTLIEFNGLQHYQPIEFFGGEGNFKKQLKRDKIKHKYASDNNINLLIFTYQDTKEIIKSKLTEILNKQLP